MKFGAKFLKLADFFSGPRVTIVLATILVLLHLAAFSYRVVVGPAVTEDTTEYLLCAKNAAEGLGFQANDPSGPFSEELLTRRPPGYPAIILLFQQSGVAVIAFQTLLSMATIFLCACFLKKRTSSRLALNALLLCFLCTPSQILYATALMSEIPFQFILTGAVFSTVLFVQTKKIKWLAITAATVSIGFFIKPALYPFTFLMLAAGIVYAYRHSMVKIVPFALLPVACVIGYSALNYSQTGVFEVSSIQATNLLNVNAKFILFQTQGIEEGANFIDSLESALDSIPSYAERQQIRSTVAKEIFMDHPFVAIYQFVKGGVLFFFDPGRFDWITYFDIDSKNGFMEAFAAQDGNAIKSVFYAVPLWMWVVLPLVLVFNLLKLFFYVLFLVKFPGRMPEKIILSTGILYILAITGSLGVCRYALPVIPLLIVGAALGVACVKMEPKK